MTNVGFLKFGREDLEHLGASLTRAIEAGTVEAMMDLLDKVASIKRPIFVAKNISFSETRNIFWGWKFWLRAIGGFHLYIKF